MGNHRKLLQFLRPDDDYYGGDTSCSTTPVTPTTSASTAASPYASSPWTQLPGLGASPRGGTAEDATTKQRTGLLGCPCRRAGMV